MKRVFGVGVALVLVVAVACTPQPEPELCPEGTFSATGEAPCTPAPPGTFVDVVGATEATECPPGRYQDEEGQTSCKLAPAGHYVAVPGSAAATKCALGTFQSLEGATSCFIAPIGTYVDTVGAAAATDCPAGTTTVFEGSISASDCVTITLDFDNSLVGTSGNWGTLTGSGLQPGADVQMCSDQFACQLGGPAVTASGGLSPVFETGPIFASNHCWTNVVWNSTTAAGDPISSNVGSYPANSPTCP